MWGQCTNIYFLTKVFVYRLRPSFNCGEYKSLVKFDVPDELILPIMVEIDFLGYI